MIIHNKIQIQLANFLNFQNRNNQEKFFRHYDIKHTHYKKQYKEVSFSSLRSIDIIQKGSVFHKYNPPAYKAPYGIMELKNDSKSKKEKNS